jgi:hypothetical protein
MDSGIEIYLGKLSTVEISADGTTAKIGGGASSKAVVDALWAAGKQTGKPSIYQDPSIAYLSPPEHLTLTLFSL